LDQDALVTAGRLIVSELNKANINPRAALWLYSPDIDSWKLLIVPKEKYNDVREFYRIIVSIINANQSSFQGISPSTIEMVKPEYPTVKALRRSIHVKDDSLFTASKSAFEGVYVEKLIVLLLDA
jgi:hypothetical protein